MECSEEEAEEEAKAIGLDEKYMSERIKRRAR